MKAHLKPAEFEVRQFTVNNAEQANELMSWAGTDITLNDRVLNVRVARGYVTARLGDWLLKIKPGLVTVIDDVTFQRNYDLHQ